MIKRFFCTLLTVALFSSPTLRSQVTLDECREMARANHPAIRMYSIVEATKECSLSNASKQWLPTVRLGALAGVYNNPASVEDLFSSSNKYIRKASDWIFHDIMNIKDPSAFTYKIEGEFAQTIYDGGISRTTKEIAEAKAQVGSAETDVTLEQVCDRVDEVYFSILLLEQRALQTESKLKVLQSVRDRAALLLTTGGAKEAELDEIDAACIESRRMATDIEASLKSFRTALSLLVGKDVSEEELTLPAYSEEPRAEGELLLLKKRADLLALEKEKIDISVRPRLDLVSEVYYGFPNRNFFKDQTSHSPKLNAFVGLRLSWDISNLYTRKNNLALISNSLEELDVKMEMLKWNMNLNNSSTLVELDRLKQNLDTDKELARLREKIRKDAELAYSQGEINATDLVSRIEDEYQAHIDAKIREIEFLQESRRLRRQ